jgi:hypothetical protein
MLKPTKGMGHPSPPPSLANAALRRASDGGSEGMAERSPYSILQRSAGRAIICFGNGVSGEPNRFRGRTLSQQIEKLFGAADVRN